MPTNRKCAMCLRLSQDEMDTLGAMAEELGMPKVSLIRQLIRDEAQRRSRSVPMSDAPAVYRYLMDIFGPKIRKAKTGGRAG